MCYTLVYKKLRLLRIVEATRSPKLKISKSEICLLLSRINLLGHIEGFIEDIEGNILLKQRNKLHILKSDGSLIGFNSLDHEPVSQCLMMSRSASGHFLAQTNKKI
jgi:hypothetical protein